MSSDLAVVEQSTTTPTTLQPLQTVDVEAAEAFMNNYQELVEALLDETDYQEIWTSNGTKKSKKKSAWRKLATAFNISDDVVEKEIIRDECQRIISARYEVIATLPNGRHGVGTGSVSIFDKIKKDDVKEPTPFELRKRFTNAEHDVISTAHTRAKSRAIADLIGAGEVSAEELENTVSKPSAKPKTKPKDGNRKVLAEKLKSKVKTAKKAKAPKMPKTKKERAEEHRMTGKDIEVVEVEYEVQDLSGDKPSMSLKEIIDSNPNIRAAVDELQAQGTTPNRDNIKSKLLDFNEMGKLTMDEYKQCKELLE